MKKITFLSLLKSYRVSLLIFTILGFIVGFFISYGIINPYFRTYDLNIESNLDPYQLFSLDYFDKFYTDFNQKNKEIEEKNNEIIKENNLDINLDFTNYNTQVNEYNTIIENNYPNLKRLTKKNSIADIDYKGLVSNIKISKLDDNNYIIHIKQKYFKNTFSSTSQSVNYGKNRIINYLKKIFINDINNINFDSNIIDTSINIYLFSGVIASLFLITHVIILFIFLIKNKHLEIKNIHNNQTIFRTPFHKKYWKLSTECFKNMKSLVTMSILFALMMCCKIIRLPSGFGDLGISLAYLVYAIICMIYGPIAGIVIGFLSDNFGFFVLGSSGIYFPGYTLDAMAAGFIYGIFLYRSKATFQKCLYSRICVNLIINVLFGSLWYCIVFLNGFTIETYLSYMLIISLPKNLFYLLPQSIVLFFVIKALAKPMRRMNLIEEDICENISLF